MANHVFAGDAQSVPSPSASPAPDAAKKKNIGPLLQLLALTKPYQVRFWWASISLLISGVLGLVYPWAARDAVDKALAHQSMTDLNKLATLLVVVALIQAVFVWVRHYEMSWLGERVVADLRVRVFTRLLELPPSWFHSRHTGEIMSRLSSDVTVIDGLVGTELSLALRHSLTLIGGVGMLFWSNWKLTLYMLGVVPPLMVFVVLFGRRVRLMSRAVQDRHAATSTRVEEVVSAMQTVQSFVREPTERQTYEDNIGAAFGASLHLIRWRATMFSVVMLAVSIAMAVILWIGGSAVVRGELTGGELTSFLLYTVMVAASVGALASLSGALQRAAGATDRIFEILRTEPEIADPVAPVALPHGTGAAGEKLGAVRFDNVQFAYPTRPDQPVLRGVSLDVYAGKAVALVGSSGAGKTTLTSLLQRFHDVTGGAVLFDGVDVRHVRLSELRRQIAIVSQEPVLFSGTIAENIAYGRPGASQADIETAAQDAHAHDFIRAFPLGYQTLVGERGVQLSGGQRQRVAIARALLANPRVLILDEATSSLDAESEALVQAALQRLMKGRTTLIIAHRLSTVRDADAIAVLDKGQLVELGKHDELMAKGGAYRRLVEHQLVGEHPMQEVA